jgi:hypothetical protein
MAGFSVTNVVERMTISAAGTPVNNAVIYLTTLRGATGSVEIPIEQYMALTSSIEGKQALRDLLQQKADSLDAPFEM